MSRPSVSFDIKSKRERNFRISFTINSIKLKNFFPNDPVKEINFALSEKPFDKLSERNKLIWIISSDLRISEIDKKLLMNLKKNTNSLIE